jgi:hypothetical protein
LCFAPVTLAKTLISFRSFKTPSKAKIKASLNSIVFLSGMIISRSGNQNFKRSIKKSLYAPPPVTNSLPFLLGSL